MFRLTLAAALAASIVPASTRAAEPARPGARLPNFVIVLADDKD